MPAVLIVDAQVHVWGSGTPLPSHRPVSAYSKDELLSEMDAAGVDAAVIHPPGWDPGSNEVALEAAWANLPELLALAKHPNVAVKATGAPSYSSEPYPYRNVHAHLRRLHDAFGPERLSWRTDITRMRCTWRQSVTLFTEEMPWLTARDKELIMGRALCTWLDSKI